jgi:hypothetical protein
MGMYTDCQNLFVSRSLKRRANPEHGGKQLEYYSLRKLISIPEYNEKIFNIYFTHVGLVI